MAENFQTITFIVILFNHFFIEICSWGCDWWEVIIGLDNGLAPISDDPVQWRICSNRERWVKSCSGVISCWNMPVSVRKRLHNTNLCSTILYKNWYILTLNVRGPSYLGLTRSISWLLMPWLLTSPGHQQPWYWLCRLWRAWSYLRKDFKYLCHICGVMT